MALLAFTAMMVLYQSSEVGSRQQGLRERTAVSTPLKLGVPDTAHDQSRLYNLFGTRQKRMLWDIFKSTVRTLVPRELRNWVRSPSKSAEWLWDAASFRLGRKELLKLSPSCELVCHPAAYKVFRRDQVEDPEQNAEFQMFLPQCSDSMLLFDIGAHFGIFSLAAAHFGGTAVAVDPSPIATRIIRTQTNLNGYYDRVKIVQAAVGEAGGTVEMLSSGVFSDGYFKMINGRSRRDVRQIPSTTIDKISQQYGEPTHIKIDVEGQEAAVLRGATGTLSRCSPVLFMELHNQMVASEGGEPGLVLDQLESLGYQGLFCNGKLVGRAAVLEKPISRMMASRTTSVSSTASR